ncbi:MAG: septum formation initiator family protein [Cytophagaceae bacterium]|nr:septum formation initiator family protein [Cytophagaceae bacterium]MDW8456087.1 septum formation initiator family protein [Cytophagaceae bacterium]
MKLKVPAFLRNFYVVSIVIFFVWMFFFDTNDFISQYQMWKNYRDLEQEKQYYIEKIEQQKMEKEALITNKRKLEKFAREKYLMKRDDEDLYIVVEE